MSAYRAVNALAGKVFDNGFVMMRFLFLCLFFLVQLGLGAHGDIHLRIESITSQIKEHPKKAELYFQRGELYFADENYRAAIRDFKKSEKFGFREGTHFALAKSYFQLGLLPRCQQYLKILFLPDRYDAKVYHLKAKYLEAKKDYVGVGKIFQTIIDSSLYVRPEAYLALAQIYHRLGLFEKEINLYLSAIDEKGYLPVLYIPLINLYEDLNMDERAIQLLDDVMEKIERKEFLTFQRGLIYKKKGNFLDFTRDMRKAMLLIHDLPPRIRNQSSVRALKKDILIQLDASENK